MTRKAPRGTSPEWDNWPADFLPLLSLDPGEGSGVAIIAVPHGSIFGDEEPDIRLIWNDEIVGPEKQQARQICHLCAEISLRNGSYVRDSASAPAQRPFPVVVEDFSLRIFSRGAELLTPVRITAMLDIKLEEMTAPAVLCRQQAGDALGTVSDDLLKDLGLWATGQKNAQEAMKHAILFLRRAKKEEAVRTTAWVTG